MAIQRSCTRACRCGPIRHLVEDLRRGTRSDHVLITHRGARAEKAGSEIHAATQAACVEIPVPGRRTARRSRPPAGERRTGRRCDRRQLLADRIRLANPLGAGGH